jgi:hypothetical protein
MANVSWHPRVVEKLKELAASGLSSGQITHQLNVLFTLGLSRSAIIGKLNRLKVPLLGGNSGNRLNARRKPTTPKYPRRVTNPLGPRKPRTKRMPHPIWSSEPFPEADREIEKYSLRLTYEQLHNSRAITQCRYIHTLESGHDVYCGNPTALGTAWCEKCYRVVYRGPQGVIQMPVQAVKVA